MRVLIFGDSITQGFWAVDGGWVERLRKHYDELQLRDLSNDNQPVIFNLGISGDVAEGVLKRVDNEIIARKWRWPTEELVFLVAIGINDTALENNKERSNPSKFQLEINQIIDRLKFYSDKIMFIGLTPVAEDVANTRQGKPKALFNDRIRQFDTVLAEVCRRNKVGYLPIFEAIESKISAGAHLFDDGLHPNDSGHQFIFELILPSLDQLIESNKV